MNESFLHALIDTSGNTHYIFKPDSSVVSETTNAESIFLLPEYLINKSGKKKYIQFYKGHQLKPLHGGAEVRNNITPDWFFPIVLIILAVFAWIRMFYSRYFFQMIAAFLNNNLANQIVRDENIFIQRASIFLSIVFNLVVALFLYLLSVQYGWFLGGVGGDFGRFIFLLILVSLAYTLKFLVLKICGWLFDKEREMATYIFNVFLINNILGMALIPFVCLLAYNESIQGPALIIVPLILASIAFAWRLFRGIQIGLGTGAFSPLYLFLYLCTLEIAPLMVLIRIAVQ